MFMQINKRLEKLKNRRAQSLSEYAILLGIVVAAIVSMQVFVKRRVQAVIYDSFEQFGDTKYVEEYNPLLGGEQRTSAFNTITTGAYRTLGSGGVKQSLIDETTKGTGYSEREEVLGGLEEDDEGKEELPIPIPFPGGK